MRKIKAQTCRLWGPVAGVSAHEESIYAEIAFRGPAHGMLLMKEREADSKKIVTELFAGAPSERLYVSESGSQPDAASSRSGKPISTNHR